MTSQDKGYSDGWQGGLWGDEPGERGPALAEALAGGETTVIQGKIDLGRADDAAQGSVHSTGKGVSP